MPDPLLHPLRRVAALIVAGLLAVLAGCSGDLPGSPGSGNASSVASGTGVAVSPAAASTLRVDLIDYTRITGLPDGVIVRTPDSVDALSGSPQDFRDYLAARITASDVSTCSVSVGVQMVRTDGYAVGTLRGCDDLRVVWAKENGVWAQVASGPQGLDCSELESRRVPAAIAGPSCRQSGSLVAYGPDIPPVSPRVAPDATGRQSYANSRFGFTCVLPEGWALKESDNGDGVTATDPSGRATASCLGRNNLADGTPGGEQTAARAALVGADVDITYDSLTSSTYVLSGHRPDGTITYEWYAVGAGSINGVVWNYPAAMKTAIDGDVTASVNAFVRGDLAQPH